MNDTAEQVARGLIENGQTVAVAESCTGGMISARLTSLPGSSKYFLGGYVVYSDAMKCAELGVSGRVIDIQGAVSEPVALALAEGARKRLASDFGIGVTGIAGPDGGTAGKPVGLVFIAVAGPDGCRAHRFQFSGNRTSVREQSTARALDLLSERLDKCVSVES